MTKHKPGTRAEKASRSRQGKTKDDLETCVKDYTPGILPAPDPKHSQSTEYGLAVLQAFTAERPTLGIADIADLTGLARSTTHRYAMTLVRHGYLEQDNKRKYRLARRAAQPGISFVDTIRLEHSALTILKDLRDQTGCTASMGLLSGTRVLYIYRLFSHGFGQYEADGDLGVGTYVPVYCTAVGKVLLASLSADDLRKRLLQISLKRVTPNTITSKALLTSAIDQAGRNGIATSDEEYIKGARSVAVRITDRSGPSALAIELTAPASAYTMEKFVASVGQPLKHAAGLIPVVS